MADQTTIDWIAWWKTSGSIFFKEFSTSYKGTFLHSLSDDPLSEIAQDRNVVHQLVAAAAQAGVDFETVSSIESVQLHDTEMGPDQLSVNVTITQYIKETALHRALRKARPVLAQSILEHGGSATTLTSSGQSALHLCAKIKTIGGGERVSLCGPLRYLVETNTLLRQMGPTAFDQLLRKVDLQGYTALHVAVQQNNLEAVRLLVDAENSCYGYGYTSGLQGRVPLSRMAPSGRGYTPVMGVSTPEMVTLLLDIASPDVGQVDWCGSSVLHWAAYRNLDGVLRAFLSHRERAALEPAVLEARDLYGQTALLEACRYGLYDAAKILLSFGANPMTRDTRGRTPLHHAMLRGHPKLAVDLLLHVQHDGQFAVDPHAVDDNKRTPLELAKDVETAREFKSLIVDRAKAVHAIAMLSAHLNADVSGVVAKFMYRDVFPDLVAEALPLRVLYTDDLPEPDSIAARVVRNKRRRLHLNLSDTTL